LLLTIYFHHLLAISHSLPYKILTVQAEINHVISSSLFVTYNKRTRYWSQCWKWLSSVLRRTKQLLDMCTW